MLDIKQWPPAGVKWYYSDEWVAIACADCRDILPLIPDKSVDLVLTSPPYDNLRTYGGYSWDFMPTAQGLVDCLSIGGVIVWVVGDATMNGSETGNSFRQALHFKDLGLNLHDTMIYQKSTPPLSHNRYEQNFEYMFVLSKGKPKTFNGIRVGRKYKDNRISKAFGKNGDDSIDYGYATKNTTVLKTNVWSIFAGGGSSDKEASEHPAIFPEQLVHDHIVSWSNKGELVIDPMCGSGTTLKIAKKLNRKCIGIEIEEKYCEIAAKRCSQSVMRLEV